MSKQKVLVLCDSRGEGLQKILTKNEQCEFTVKSWKGHNVMQVAIRGVGEIKSVNPNLIIIFAGITKITKMIKHVSPWKLILRNKSIKQHVRDFEDDLYSARQCIIDHCREEGIEIHTYNIILYNSWGQSL